ncbi:MULTISPECIES: hypothetical protein [Arsenophonus]|jgi:hypothetical protein|uniref:OspG family effector kinase n=1 Tax=Arsenophonus TaxID=637 RepID=UPI0015D784B8|nr:MULTISPECIES: hypothetical protein [Arsenophonus]UBX29134.1 hypothetical protein LDL57_15540 [Arsenophonus apicola]
MTAEDYLIESLGGIDSPENKKWAHELLSKYDFPANSCHNSLEFAIHYLQCQQIPDWAEQYKIAPIETNVIDQEGNVCTLSYFANHPIHSGVDGEVFQDNDENYVLKKYHENYNYLDDSELGTIEKSIAFFCHYYGEDSAKIYYDEENLFVRMKKIAGIPLSKIDSLPTDAIEKFESMLATMVEKNIFHSDLQQDNILWDRYESKFNPIDFGDDPRNYSSILDPEELLQELKYNAENCVKLIEQKIITPDKQTNLFQQMIFRNLV